MRYCIFEGQYGVWLRALVVKRVKRGDLPQNRQNEVLIIKIREDKFRKDKERGESGETRNELSEVSIKDVVAYINKGANKSIVWKENLIERERDEKKDSEITKEWVGKMGTEKHRIETKGEGIVMDGVQNNKKQMTWKGREMKIDMITQLRETVKPQLKVLDQNMILERGKERER